MATINLDSDTEDEEEHPKREAPAPSVATDVQRHIVSTGAPRAASTSQQPSGLPRMVCHPSVSATPAISGTASPAGIVQQLSSYDQRCCQQLQPAAANDRGFNVSCGPSMPTSSAALPASAVPTASGVASQQTVIVVDLCEDEPREYPQRMSISASANNSPKPVVADREISMHATSSLGPQAVSPHSISGQQLGVDVYSDDHLYSSVVPPWHRSTSAEEGSADEEKCAAGEKDSVVAQDDRRTMRNKGGISVHAAQAVRSFDADPTFSGYIVPAAQALPLSDADPTYAGRILSRCDARQTASTNAISDGDRSITYSNGSLRLPAVSNGSSSSRATRNDMRSAGSGSPRWLHSGYAAVPTAEKKPPTQRAAPGGGGGGVSNTKSSAPPLHVSNSEGEWDQNTSKADYDRKIAAKFKVGLSNMGEKAENAGLRTAAAAAVGGPAPALSSRQAAAARAESKAAEVDLMRRGMRGEAKLSTCTTESVAPTGRGRGRKRARGAQPAAPSSTSTGATTAEAAPAAAPPPPPPLKVLRTDSSSRLQGNACRTPSQSPRVACSDDKSRVDGVTSTSRDDSTRASRAATNAPVVTVRPAATGDLPTPRASALDAQANESFPRPVARTASLHVPKGVPLQRQGSRTSYTFPQAKEHLLLYCLAEQARGMMTGVKLDQIWSEAAENGRATPLPVSFESEQQYAEAFRPMVLLELRGEVRRGLEEMRESDRFLKGRLNVAEPPRKAEELIDVPDWACWDYSILCNESTQLSEADIIAVSGAGERAPLGSTDERAGGDPWMAFARSLPSVGVVSSTPRDGKLLLRLALPANLDRDRKPPKGGGGDGERGGEGGWQAQQLRLVKLGNCVTSAREWRMLHQLRSLSERLRLNLLKGSSAAAATMARADGIPRDPRHEGRRWEKRQRHIETLVKANGLDKSQGRLLTDLAEKVHQRHEGFVLVQGPPGTGKTTLLLALLNVLHNAQTQDHFEEIIERAMSGGGGGGGAGSGGGGAGGAACLPRGHLDSILRTVGETVSSSGPHKRRGRILVCAQSNAAVDELLSRLLAQRRPFRDEYGKPYQPDVVRIGRHAAASVDDCTISTVAEKKLANAWKRGAASRDALKREINEVLDKKTNAAKCLPRLRAKVHSCAQAMNNDASPDRRAELARATEEKNRFEGAVVDAHDVADRLKAELAVLNVVWDGSSRGGGSGGGGGGGSAMPRLSRDQLRKLEEHVLQEAHIVFCTMSSAADLRLEKLDGGFETVVFDEAAQASELATLIPLRYGARLAILVGDPQQLPATVLSMRAKELGYASSLFERLQRLERQQRRDWQPHMLQVQYRMHPAIRAFPSRHFYGNALRDSESVQRAMRRAAGSVGGPPGVLSTENVESRVAPYVIFNLRDSKQEQAHKSKLNKPEADFCCRLLRALQLLQARYVSECAEWENRKAGAAVAKGEPCATHGCSCGWGHLCGKIAVLTPYNGQVAEIKRSARRGGRDIASAFDDVATSQQLLQRGALQGAPQGGQQSAQQASGRSPVSVSNVDAFQGRESDIVIYSAVRSEGRGIGFVKDRQRMNVALTRASHALFVVGDMESLAVSRDWAALIQDARERGCCVDASVKEALRMSDTELMDLIPRTLLDGAPARSVGQKPADGLLVSFVRELESGEIR